MTDEPTFELAGIPATKPTATRMSLLLWGQSGVGKTTLASTLPGKKMLISFDPDGPVSIADDPDTTVFDFSNTTDTITDRFKNGDPFGMGKLLPQFDSVIVDSLTTIADRTLTKGIKLHNGATIERPGIGAYGTRNALVLALVRGVLAKTGEHNKHVCFIAHEASPDKDDKGNVTEITLALGGELPNGLGIRLNECWCVFENTSRQKMVIVRKSRLRTPAKSRMFNTMKDSEFEWKWNTENRNDPSNMWIRDWFDAWKANNFAKMAMPKAPTTPSSKK